jgi:ubiquinol-cytochrome c reductase cytochrome c subunit
VHYVGSFGGPPIPQVHPERGSLAVGREAFTENCAGCHQVVAEGGIAGEGVVPDLKKSKPIDVAEAVGVGPYVMPRFTKDLDQHQIDSIARYVNYAKKPDDRGGFGLGHIGPIPEGMVAWLLAGAVLLLVIRLIGERTTE